MNTKRRVFSAADSLRAGDRTHRKINVLLALGNKLSKRGYRSAALLVDTFVRIIFSADVPSRLDLPPDVTFMHNGLGTVIDEHVRFTGPALIFQHVTIGNLVGRPGGAPTIGRHVVIATGATIIGDIRLGDGCFIGAGAVVARDVEPNTMVRASRPDFIQLTSTNADRFWGAQ